MIISDYPGAFKVTTRVPVGKEGSRKVTQRCDDRSRGQSDAIAGRNQELKKCRWHLEAKKSKEQILLWSLQKDPSPADTFH